MPEHPRAVREGIVVEQLGDGVVIYDSATGQAHALDALSSAVFGALDGERSLGDVAASLGVAPGAVAAATDQLAARGLVLEVSALSRRTMLRRTAVLGAAAIGAAPVIETVLIPTAAAHASTSPGGGGGNPPPNGPPPARLDAYIKFVSAAAINVDFPPDKNGTDQGPRDLESYPTGGGTGAFSVETFNGSAVGFTIYVTNSSGPQSYLVETYNNSNVLLSYQVLTPGQTAHLFVSPTVSATVATVT